MTSHLFKYLIVALWLILISWGPRGHRITALVADKNLTLQTRHVVDNLLNGQSMADVSNWSDEAANQNRRYSNLKLHRLNIPVDVETSYHFNNTLALQKAPNLYTSIIYQISILRDSKLSKGQKSVALKNLIHLIGDIHQPMDIFKEPKPNFVLYNGQKIALYDFWEHIILDGQKESDIEIADSLNNYWPTPFARVTFPQYNADLRYWLSESYGLNAYLLQNAPAVADINNKRYEKDRSIIYTQLFLGGMRLANLLNLLFDDNSDGTKLIQTRAYIEPQSVRVDSTAVIGQSSLKDIEKLINHNVKLLIWSVAGVKIYDDEILLNVTKDFPYQQLTIVLVGEAMSYFKEHYSDSFYATGKLTLYNGKPELIIAQLKYFEAITNMQ